MPLIVPLFPLQTVLFPGMPLPLRIFEARYLQMIADCQQAAQQHFGVCLIRAGAEVGDIAEPYGVGTLARIERLMKLHNGHMLLQTSGTRRFRIRRLIVEANPYLTGEVELIEEDQAPPDLPAALQVQALYERYLELLRALGTQTEPISLAAADSNELSWLVAATLMLPTISRQELLQIDRTPERLQREVTLLQEHIRVLEGRQPGRQYPFSVN